MDRACCLVAALVVMLVLASPLRARLPGALFRGPAPTPARPRAVRTMSAAAVERLDAHLYVWAPKDQQAQFPFAVSQPCARSTATRRKPRHWR